MRRLLDRQSSHGSLRRHLLTEPRRPHAVRKSPRAQWYVVATVCVGAFMGQLDASIVTLALPRLGRDLHAGVGAVEWVALSYLLVLVATVATVGRIADALGRKLLYVYGFGVFTASSVLCGLAPTLAVLIAARVLQALGAAMLQANSVALITEAMPRPLLGRAIGVQGTAQALGLALGPAIGGLLLSLAGWRLIFLVNLPAGVIGLALGWLLLPRSRSRRPIENSDWPGAVLLALAAAGPLLYLSLAGRASYADPLMLGVLAVGAAAGIEFVRRERRVREPLIDLALLRRRALSVGLSSGLVSYLVLFGTLFTVPYYLSATGDRAALIGLQVAVLPLAIGIAAPVAGRLLDRIGARPLTAGGLLLTAAGLLEIALRHNTAGLLAGLAIAGLGLGAFTPANNATIMSASPRGHTGVVSGLLNMTRGIGTALGVALASAVYIAAYRAGSPTAPLTAAANGLTAALATLGGIALVAGAMVLLRPETATAEESGDDAAGARRPMPLAERAGGDPEPDDRRHRTPRRGPRNRTETLHRSDSTSARNSTAAGRPGWPLVAREWQRMSFLSLGVAAVAGARAAAAQPRWDTGDLLVGIYFALLSLFSWERATRITRVRAIRASNALRVISLLLGLGLAAMLVLTDVATAGRL